MSGRSRAQPTAVIPTAETKEAFLNALGEARRLAIQTVREVRFGCPLHRALDAFKADVDQLAFFLTGRNRVLPRASWHGTEETRRVKVPEVETAARLLVRLEEALEAAERAGMAAVASLLRVAIAMLKPSVGAPEEKDRPKAH